MDRNHPADDSLQARLYRRRDEAPDRRTLAFVARDGGVRWLSVEEAHERASAYGRGLLERGCGPGERCMLVLSSDEECTMILLGALLAGAVPLLVAPPILQQSDHSALQSNLSHTMGLVRPSLLVGSSHLSSLGEEADRMGVETVFDPGSLARSGSRLPRTSPRGDDTAALQLTSGTTGVPRVCQWRQRNVLAALDGMTRAMALDAEDVCFNWTPLYHDMGLVNNFLLCMTTGVPLAMLEPTLFVRKPALWIRGLADTGATQSWSPNFGFALAAERVRDAEVEGVRLDHVRALWNAAERIHVETMLGFYERFSGYGLEFDALKTNFGCAENVGGATFSDMDEPFGWETVDMEMLQEERVARSVDGADPELRTESVASAGRPVPGMRIVIADPEGRPLPEGHVGEVLLDTPSRMTGYLGDPQGTASAFVNGLLRTGDLGYLRDGELFWVGRVRERITVRGKKVDPSEFEAVLFRIPELRPGCFVAFGVPDPHLGTERPVVVSELQDGHSRPLSDIAADVIEACGRDLGLMLENVVLVPKGALAKTSSGKRRHSHFREVYERGDLEGIYASRGASV